MILLRRRLSVETDNMLASLVIKWRERKRIMYSTLLHLIETLGLSTHTHEGVTMGGQTE